MQTFAVSCTDRELLRFFVFSVETISTSFGSTGGLSSGSPIDFPNVLLVVSCIVCPQCTHNVVDERHGIVIIIKESRLGRTAAFTQQTIVFMTVTHPLYK